jgi:DNA-binding beta-propeller fold protein YncE
MRFWYYENRAKITQFMEEKGQLQLQDRQKETQTLPLVKQKPRRVSLLLGALLLFFVIPLTVFFGKQQQETRQRAAGTTIQHYLYVAPEGGTVYVYDIDNSHALVKTIPLPSNVVFIRGMGADIAQHALFLAYGGIGGKGGQLMKMDLLTNQVIYTKPLPLASDSFDITPDGKTLYQSDGDTQSNGIWRVIDAATGTITSSINTGGHNPHNTIVSLNGNHVYMGPRLSNYLVMADTSTNQIIRQIGPMQSGVRPFTINSNETLAFIETSDFLGFDVANIQTGQIIYKASIPGKSTTGGLAPAHGISLSPNEKELYVSDWPNSKVHVFDLTGLPGSPPKPIIDIPVHNMVGNETPCIASNCQKEGWVLHSLSGRYVYVGDAGDVIDTTTRKPIAYLQPLSNTRKFIEIDWQNGLPITTSSRYGKGRAGMNTPTSGVPSTTTLPTTLPGGTQGIQHLMYTFYQNTITVYDMDHGQTQAQTITLPQTVYSVRGVSTDIASKMLYIAYSSNSSNGSLLKYNLATNQVVYTKTYTTGIDSFALTKDGASIFMPDGDGQGDNLWHVIDTATGNVTGAITAGSCPHNTVTGPSGKYIYLAGRCSPYVFVVDPATKRVIRQIGPFKNGGVRPFTVNSSETMVFVTDNNFIGFEVGDVATGKVLATVPATGFTCNCQSFDSPSHGISLAPDEKEAYIPDRFNGDVHVFDVSHLPSQTPSHITDIKLVHPITGNVPPPCTLDCNREGWVLHSRDGRFVYVGDSGDVIDTTSRSVIANLSSLSGSRIYVEIDWQNSTPVLTTNRYGVGYANSQPSPQPTGYWYGV